MAKSFFSHANFNVTLFDVRNPLPTCSLDQKVKEKFSVYPMNRSHRVILLHILIDVITVSGSESKLCYSLSSILSLRLDLIEGDHRRLTEGTKSIQ